MAMVGIWQLEAYNNMVNHQLTIYKVMVMRVIGHQNTCNGKSQLVAQKDNSNNKRGNGLGEYLGA
jgi:hypothetical protein